MDICEALRRLLAKQLQRTKGVPELKIVWLHHRELIHFVIRNRQIGEGGYQRRNFQGERARGHSRMRSDTTRAIDCSLHRAIAPIISHQNTQEIQNKDEISAKASLKNGIDLNLYS